MGTTRVSRRLPSLGDSIRHGAVIIGVSTVAFIGLGAALAVTANHTYTASAVVLLSPVPGSPLTADAASAGASQLTVAMSTEAQLAKMPAVAEIASRSLGRDVPGDDERVTASVVATTQMLDFTYSSTSAAAARNGAQAFAEGYLDYRADRATTLQDSRVSSLQAQIDDTDTELRGAVADASSAGEQAAYASQEVQLLADRLAQLNNALSAARAVSVAPGSVIDSASLPASHDGIPSALFLAAAGLLGALVGIAFAMFREWRRDLLRDSDAEALAIPVLASVALPAPSALPIDDPVIHETFRQLRTAMVANAPRPHVLAVSAVSEAGSAQVATGLALVLAEAKFSVLLVAAATPPDERVETLLSMRGREGLAEVIARGADPSDYLTTVSGVSVLTSGRGDVDDRDITVGHAFRGIVDDMRSRFDYVILIAGHAGSSIGDGALLSADSALLVLTPGTTTRALIEATLDRLGRLHLRIMGAINVTHIGASSPAIPPPREDAPSRASSAPTESRVAD